MISRIHAIRIIAESLQKNDLVVSTTGMISRELFITDDRSGNFYMLGSMGLVSSFALGLALLNPSNRVVALEGDGSALMSMGTLALVASEAPEISCISYWTMKVMNPPEGNRQSPIR